MQSRDIAEKVPAEKLIRSYGGLHTVDEDMAIEIIMQDFGLTKPKDAFAGIDFGETMETEE
jgi:hypothetical protein